MSFQGRDDVAPPLTPVGRAAAGRRPAEPKCCLCLPDGDGSLRTLPMSYVETLPPPLLRPFVDRFWARSDVGEPRSERPHRILPDGCIDVIIDLAHGRAEVVGTMTRAIVVPVHPSACLVAVRFKPGAAVPFLEVAARELTDRKIPVAELGRNALDLRHAAGRSPGEALAILENALLIQTSLQEKDSPVGSGGSNPLLKAA